MAVKESFKCSNCGAEINLQTLRCDYCGAQYEDNITNNNESINSTIKKLVCGGFIILGIIIVIIVGCLIYLMNVLSNKDSVEYNYNNTYENNYVIENNYINSVVGNEVDSDVVEESPAETITNDNNEDDENRAFDDVKQELDGLVDIMCKFLSILGSSIVILGMISFSISFYDCDEARKYQAVLKIISGVIITAMSTVIKLIL